MIGIVEMTGAEMLGDVLAYLEQRAENAALMAARSPEFEEMARERARQLDVMIDDFRQGLHIGCATARTALLAARNEEGKAR